MRRHNTAAAVAAELREAILSRVFAEGEALARTEEILALDDEQRLLGAFKAIDDEDLDGEPLPGEDYQSCRDWWLNKSSHDRAEVRRAILRGHVREVLAGWQSSSYAGLTNSQSDRITCLLDEVEAETVRAITLADLIRYQVTSCVSAERSLDGVCRIRFGKHKLPHGAATKLMRGEMEADQLKLILTGDMNGDLWPAAVDLAHHRRAAWRKRHEAQRAARAADTNTQGADHGV